MFQVVVSLKECIAGEELHEDTADAPDIAWETPTQAQDDLRSTVMSGGDDRRVIFVLERGRSEIDQTNLRIEQHLAITDRSGDRGRRRGDLTTVGEGLVSPIDEENIFRLQIGMNQVEIMQD